MTYEKRVRYETVQTLYNEGSVNGLNAVNIDGGHKKHIYSGPSAPDMKDKVPEEDAYALYI